jgi:hypothetical protein
MTSLISADHVVEYLCGLPDREFIELMHKVFSAKADDKVFENGEYSFDRMCLATTSYGVYEGVAEPPAINLIGQVADEVAQVPWDALCQFGQCETCGSTVISVGKLAVCPVCSTEVECT